MIFIKNSFYKNIIYFLLFLEIHMDNLSQSSFRSSGSMFHAPRKAFVDGEMLDGEYVTK